MARSFGKNTRSFPRRRGAVASLDYVLLLGVIFPMAAFALWAGPRIIRLTYNLVYSIIAWPFM
ncbi:hypothetical protein JCM19992_15730 [Thermostilla marina]